MFGTNYSIMDFTSASSVKGAHNAESFFWVVCFIQCLEHEHFYVFIMSFITVDRLMIILDHPIREKLLEKKKVGVRPINFRRKIYAEFHCLFVDRRNFSNIFTPQAHNYLLNAVAKC